jgi:hypothetical protein
VVKLTKDLPEHGLKTGAVGTVVMAFQEPDEAYEVEFCNQEGETVHMDTFSPDELELVQSIDTIGKS